MGTERGEGVKKSKNSVDIINGSPLKLKATHFSIASGHTQFVSFCEECPDGHIDKKSFRNLMRTCYPGRNLERLEKRIFNMYDENRDGRISFAEFMVVMYVMSNGTPEENFKQGPDSTANK